MHPFLKRLCLIILVSVLHFGCSSKAAALLQEAENLWFKSDYREAIRLYMQVVDRYPDAEEAETALFRAGETYMLNLSDPDKAIEHLTRLTIEYPNGKYSISARKFMASIFEKSLKDYNQAIIQYQKLIDSRKVETPDRYQLAIARCYYLKGDYMQAIIEYNLVSERYPESELVPEAEYQKGNCYFVMNNCEKAMKQYNFTLENHPNIESRYDILLSIGICMEERDEYGRALEIYKDILDKYENRALIEKKIASVQERMRAKHR